MGLNDSFAAVRGQILLMEPLPGINKVFSLVQNHETQKGAGILPLPIGLPTVDNTALISRMNNELMLSHTPILLLIHCCLDLIIVLTTISSINISTLGRTNLYVPTVVLRDMLWRNATVNHISY